MLGADGSLIQVPSATQTVLPSAYVDATQQQVQVSEV